MKTMIQNDKNHSDALMYQLRRFSNMSTPEINIERAHAIDRLNRICHAQRDLDLFCDSKETSILSEEEFNQQKSEVIEGVQVAYGIPESVYIFSGTRLPENKGRFETGIRKIFTGRMPEVQAAQWAFLAEEVYEFDYWWVIFGQGVGYYGCESDIEIEDTYSDLIAFATRR